METLLLQELYMDVTCPATGHTYKKYNLLYKLNPLTQVLCSHFPGISPGAIGGFQGQQLHLSEPPLQMQPRAHLAQPGGQQGQQPEKSRRWTDELWLFTSHPPPNTLGEAAESPEPGGCVI